ncbi:MAG: F0F1 ATP synthase subunit B [Acidimicrobiia bacterium]
MLAVVTRSGAQLASVKILAQEESDSEESTTTAEGEGHSEAKDCTSSEKFNNPSQCVDKEPNPVLPEYREIAWGLGSFLVLLAIIRLVAYPRLKAGMDARAAKISGDFDAAERAKDSVGAEREAYLAKLAAAKAEAASILDSARGEVEAVRAQKMAALNAELAQLRAQAAEEISASRATAVASMRGTVTDLAVGAAERVVARPIDRNANAGVVDDFVNQAGLN